MQSFIQVNLRKLLSYNLLLGSLLAFSACTDNDNPTPKGKYSNGVFVTNEGAFGQSNGEISFFDLDSNKITNGIFGKNNLQPNGQPRPLGDVIQSLLFTNESGYIVANNTNKLIIVDANTFVQKAEITLKQPRYMVVNGNTGYVTEWVKNDYQNPPKGRIAIIDLQTNTTAVKDTITTNGFFPDRLLFLNNRLYVLNSQENTVSILNTQTKAFEKKVEVGERPAGIVLDKNNNLWILTSGEADYSNYPEVKTLQPGKLLRCSVNGADLKIENSFTFSAFGGSDLVMNAAKDKLYYSFNGQVFEQDITATTLATQPLLKRSFYGMGIDPKNNVLYGGVAPSFTNNGWMIRYNLTTKAPIDSAAVGIGPNGFVFR